ncbi:MAG: SpoIIE family protein phosphatase [Crocinitomicaceae bacterium]|nr:SpoIIE family protein phosphatase [Crocinitomicaceae bacterium]
MRNRRVIIGFIILISIFSISEYVSFRRLEESREINSRNAQIFQPSIIYLNELYTLISDSEKYTESWVFFDITDHDDKEALRLLHTSGANAFMKDLVTVSKRWEDKEEENRVLGIASTLDSIMVEQKVIMSKLSSLNDYSKENWLVLIEVEGQHLARVKELSKRAKSNLNILIARMKERSLEEKEIAAKSFDWIRYIHIILDIVVVVISVLVAWSILRFLKLEEQKKAISNERDEILKQKEIIEEKNTSILSSISYAKRLQTSMLPAKDEIAKNFKDHFIFYKPRDIVSGDFYWHRNINSDGKQLVLIAAADATGHGVPGAFVSFVCYSTLNRAVDEFKLMEPCKILDKVSELVSSTFSSSENDDTVYDGMDISLCVFDFEANELHFSGANNSAYVLRDGEMTKLKATRKPIGRSIETGCFTSEKWILNEGDLIYMFSDGFQDQFGGDRGKKYRAKRFQEFLSQIGENESLSDQPLKDEFND